MHRLLAFIVLLVFAESFVAHISIRVSFSLNLQKNDEEPASRPLFQRLPKLSIPKLSLPEVSLPNMTFPNVKLPSLSLPSLSLPSFRDSKWITVCEKTAINPGSITPVFLPGDVQILLIAPSSSDSQQELYAIDGACPHLGTDLSLGKQSFDAATGKDCITCPLHRTKFDLTSGEVVGDWCPYPPILGGVAGIFNKDKGVKPQLINIDKNSRRLTRFEVRTTVKKVQIKIMSDLE